MKIKAIRKRTKGFISLLLVLSVMVSLLVPFDITVFAEDDAPATGSNIHALVYKDGSNYTLVFQNDTVHYNTYGNLLQVLCVQGVGGALMLYLYLRTKNIMVPYLAHMLLDVIAILGSTPQ